jgi:hypothetical protein
MKLITTCILLLFVSINTNADVSVLIDTHARERIALVIGNLCQPKGWSTAKWVAIEKI